MNLYQINFLHGQSCMMEADNPQKAIIEAIKVIKPNAVVDITPTKDKSKCTFYGAGNREN